MVTIIEPILSISEGITYGRYFWGSSSNQLFSGSCLTEKCQGEYLLIYFFLLPLSLSLKLHSFCFLLIFTHTGVDIGCF